MSRPPEHDEAGVVVERGSVDESEIEIQRERVGVVGLLEVSAGPVEQAREPEMSDEAE